MNLIELSNLTENQAREYFESQLWPDGPVCPHCGNAAKIYKLEGKATRPGLYKCAECKKQFTVTVGTILHRSHITMKQWLVGFHMMNSSKKGMSAKQLQRELGLGSYEAAWFLTHRIRSTMDETPLAEMLKGTVEVDETYIGGKNKPGSKRGRGTKKAPVMTIISRDDDKAMTKPIKKVNASELKGTIRQIVAYQSRIMTDEWSSYNGIGNHYASGHCTVNHSQGEYSRGDVHVNNAESFFALLKRGVHGTFHHITVKHLGRYCHEFNFRWNRRKVTDGQRTKDAICRMAGRRLLYQTLIA